MTAGAAPATATAQLRRLSCEELARRSRQGCRASFAQLADRYSARLHRFLSHWTNNAHDTEDLVQDTFVRAYANITSYQDSYKFSTWLYTIARHLASSRLRRLHRRKPILEKKAAASAAQREPMQEETTGSLWRVAESLSANQYRMLWLKYAEDISVRGIAGIMGKSQASVKVTLYRARRRLAEKLRDMAKKARSDGMELPEGVSAFVKVKGAKCSVGSSD